MMKGSFSNTATQNSDLTAEFFIDAPNKVSLFLYEYAGSNPVKTLRELTYEVNFQSSDGSKHRLRARNWSDRLNFGPQHSTILTNAFKKGGVHSFRIVESEYQSDRYAFSTLDTKYMDNALRLLEEKER